MKMLKGYKQFIEEFSVSTEEERSLKEEFLTRIGQGRFTREENPVDHFGVFFWPYNPKTQEVFIVHHKKSGKWLAPGGHIEVGELPIDTLKREIKEELGFSPKQLEETPFMISITPVTYLYGYRCKLHYDIWFVVATDGREFKVDIEEFHTTRWVLETVGGV
ncbi:MAG: NUDIX domain-containing protein [Candidatus Levybacteria bacterium]|nr:NUDIX domain-containing protein [Candidatus Levybacteria bacterium]